MSRHIVWQWPRPSAAGTSTDALGAFYACVFYTSPDDLRGIVGNTLTERWDRVILADAATTTIAAKDIDESQRARAIRGRRRTSSMGPPP